MKADFKLDHNNPNLFKATGIDGERAEQVDKFIDDLLLAATAKNGIRKTEVIEKIINFADSTLEAVLIYGFYESKFTEISVKHEILKHIIDMLPPDLAYEISGKLFFGKKEGLDQKLF